MKKEIGEIENEELVTHLISLFKEMYCAPKYSSLEAAAREDIADHFNTVMARRKGDEIRKDMEETKAEILGRMIEKPAVGDYESKDLYLLQSLIHSEEERSKSNTISFKKQVEGLIDGDLAILYQGAQASLGDDHKYVSIIKKEIDRRILKKTQPS